MRFLLLTLTLLLAAPTAFANRTPRGRDAPRKSLAGRILERMGQGRGHSRPAASLIMHSLEGAPSSRLARYGVLIEALGRNTERFLVDPRGRKVAGPFHELEARGHAVLGVRHTAGRAEHTLLFPEHGVARGPFDMVRAVLADAKDSLVVAFSKETGVQLFHPETGARVGEPHAHATLHDGGLLVAPAPGLVPAPNAKAPTEHVGQLLDGRTGRLLRQVPMEPVSAVAERGPAGMAFARQLLREHLPGVELPPESSWQVRIDRVGRSNFIVTFWAGETHGNMSIELARSPLRDYSFRPSGAAKVWHEGDLVLDTLHRPATSDQVRITPDRGGPGSGSGTREPKPIPIRIDERDRR